MTHRLYEQHQSDFLHIRVYGLRIMHDKKQFLRLKHEDNVISIICLLNGSAMICKV